MVTKNKLIILGLFLIISSLTITQVVQANCCWDEELGLYYEDGDTFSDNTNRICNNEDPLWEDDEGICTSVSENICCCYTSSVHGYTGTVLNAESDCNGDSYYGFFSDKSPGDDCFSTCPEQGAVTNTLHVEISELEGESITIRLSEEEDTELTTQTLTGDGQVSFTNLLANTDYYITFSYDDCNHTVTTETLSWPDNEATIRLSFKDILATCDSQDDAQEEYTLLLTSSPTELRGEAPLPADFTCQVQNAQKETQTGWTYEWLLEYLDNDEIISFSGQSSTTNELSRQAHTFTQKGEFKITCTAKLDENTLSDSIYASTTLPKCDWECGFSGGKTCGQYDYCTATNPDECGEDEFTGTLPIKACATPPRENCGDGDIDAGEECDGEDLNGESCERLRTYYSGGDLKCNNYCQYDTSGCIYCPEEPISCTPDQCEECASCQDSGLCIEDEENCQESVISFDENNIQSEENTFYIRGWLFSQSQNCKSFLDSFTIYRCDNSSENSCTKYDADKTQFMDGTEQGSLYKDKNLASNSNYCYIIEARMIQDNRYRQVYEIASEVVCKETGHPRCMFDPPKGQFCADYGPRINCDTELYDCETGNNVIVACDENQQIEVEGNCGFETCNEGEEGTASCSTYYDCEFCGGLFDMYSYLGVANKKALFTPFLVTNRFGEERIAYRPCSEPSIYRSEDDSTQIPACYQSKGLTVAEQFSQCEEIESCYDYTTKKECERNPCENRLSCTWNELETIGAELGLGVCAPIAPIETEREELAQCERCNTDNYLSPTCTKDICELYSPKSSEGEGDHCYFVNNFDRPGDCLSKKNVICENYLTEWDCTGGQGVQVNVQYEIEQGRSIFNQPISGNNTKIEGNDVTGIGVCEWDVDYLGRGSCYRNADNFTEIGESDCQPGLAKNLKLACERDTKAPQTNLGILKLFQENDEDVAIYSTRQFFMPLAVEDNYYPSSEVFTFFGLAQGEYAYPNMNFETLSTTKFPSGKYNLTYYSTDKAANLEEIHQDQIIIDNDAPNRTHYTITKTILVIPRVDPSQDDIYLNNVSLEFKFTDDHGPINCSFNLALAGMEKAEERRIVVESNNSFFINYSYLEDGLYSLSYTCSDHPHLRNNVSEEITFTLEADASISNPKPIFEKLSNGNDITISIDTKTNATCYYSKENETLFDEETGEAFYGQDGYDNIYLFETENGRNHSARVSGLTDGIHLYYTGCNFTNSDGVELHTDRNFGDWIYFSVDTMPPIPTLHFNNGILYDEDDAEWNKQRRFIIACEDEGVPYVEDSWNPNHGVEMIRFALCPTQTYVREDCSFNDLPFDNVKSNKALSRFEYGLNLHHLQVNSTRYLFYSCEDYGNTESEWEFANTKIRNTDFKVRGIEVCYINATNQEVCEEAK